MTNSQNWREAFCFHNKGAAEFLLIIQLVRTVKVNTHRHSQTIKKDKMLSLIILQKYTCSIHRSQSRSQSLWEEGSVLIWSKSPYILVRALAVGSCAVLRAYTAADKGLCAAATNAACVSYWSSPGCVMYGCVEYPTALQFALIWLAPPLRGNKHNLKAQM